ncbi:predicted protein [Postia placenta Mad-698-R]|nr:predicted protein [Postia placenta Mad-698-R]
MFIVYVDFTGCFVFYTVVDVYRNVLVDAPTRDVVTIVTRGSVVVSDTLVVAATWYYISRTTSVRTQLVRDMWAVRPTLTTVMFRDGTSYFLIISLLNIVDLIMETISSSSISKTTYIEEAKVMQESRAMME